MNLVFTISLCSLLFALNTTFAQVNLSLPPDIPSDYPSEINSEKVYREVSKKATPKGGLTALYRHIMDNMQYPKEALSKKIRGKVYVLFIVQKDRKLSNMIVTKGIGYGCDKEAMRVLKTIEWVPATQNDEPVHSVVQMPIGFYR